MEHWAKRTFSKKITPKHVQNTYGHFWEQFCAFLDFWKLFDFLKKFRRLDLPWNTGQKNFEKITPKTCSKHVWTLLGTNLGIFGLLKIFGFFGNISKTRPSMEHWVKKVYERVTQKHVQNTFGHFWERFWAFLDFRKFFYFFENISKTRPSMEHWAKKVYEKITQKHVQNTFGHFWERFWAFLEFWNFFDFLKTIRRLDPPWNTGQKNFFEKSTPKTCSKHVWTLLGTILGIFGLLKFFRFFKNISKTRPSMEHWAKNVCEKITPKHVQNTFGQFGNDFGPFRNVESFLF